jgi:hypothetical protein
MTRRLRPDAAVRIAGTLVLFAASGAFLFAATRGEAQKPLPGLSAGVSALERLPAASNIPPDVLKTLGYLDPRVVGPSHEAAPKLRRLRADLGTAHLGLYALRSKTGSVCFILERDSALCPSAITAGSPGLLWTIGGGTEAVPGSLAGVAADPVEAVELTIDGNHVPATLKNNAVFAELPAGGHEASIVVRFDDGRTETIDVQLD